MMWPRFVRFNAVGGVGIGVQLAALWVLTHVSGVQYLLATALAVGAAIVHNFLWHRRWTWADRADPGRGVAGSFARYALTNGLVSLAGNLVLMASFVSGLHLVPVVANMLAIGCCGLLNFWLADRIVFRDALGGHRPSIPD
jgi:putative flippase GtrA